MLHALANHVASFCPLQRTPFQLGVNPQLYQHLQSAWNLHPFTIGAILNNNGAFGGFHDAALHEQDKSVPMSESSWVNRLFLAALLRLNCSDGVILTIYLRVYLKSPKLHKHWLRCHLLIIRSLYRDHKWINPWFQHGKLG